MISQKNFNWLKMRGQKWWVQMNDHHKNLCSSSSPLSFLFYNSFIELMMRVVVRSLGNNGTSTSSDKKLSDLEYTVGVVPLNKQLSKFHVSLSCLNESVGQFEMRLEPSKCYIPWQNKLTQSWVLFSSREQLGRVDGSNYLSSCTSPGGHISDEVPSRTQKAEMAFPRRRHL